jgi:hypothetical protein
MVDLLKVAGRMDSWPRIVFCLSFSGLIVERGCAEGCTSAADAFLTLTALSLCLRLCLRLVLKTLFQCILCMVNNNYSTRKLFRTVLNPTSTVLVAGATILQIPKSVLINATNFGVRYFQSLKCKNIEKVSEAEI